MSSRRAKNPRLRLPGWKKSHGAARRLQIASHGLAEPIDEWDPRKSPIVQALLAQAGPNAEITDEALETLGISIKPPENMQVVVKEVPAVVTHPETKEKVQVGTAMMHADGSVSVRYEGTPPEWATDLIKTTIMEVGKMPYRVETEGDIDGVSGPK